LTREVLCGCGVLGESRKTTRKPVVFLLGFLVQRFSFSSTIRTGAVQTYENENENENENKNENENENKKIFVFVFVSFRLT
jgi:hypothetical protein